MFNILGESGSGSDFVENATRGGKIVLLTLAGLALWSVQCQYFRPVVILVLGEYQKVAKRRSHSPKMSPHLICLLVLLGMMGAVSCEGTPCTPATCMDAPVLIFFTTTDCSGAGSLFNYAYDESSTYGQCQVQTATSSYRLDVTSEFVAYTEVNNPNCDISLSNVTYYIQQDYFGKCRPRSNSRRGAKDMKATTSWMVLPNANATYTSPQPAPLVDLNYPNIYTDVHGIECQSATNCTAANGDEPQLITYNTPGDSCTPTSAYGIYNASYDGSTCYRMGDLYYVSYHCVDEHAYATLSYLDSACQNVFYAEYNRRVCSGATSGFFSCLATPIPLVPFATPTSPPSSPPSSSPSPPPSSSPTSSPSSSPTSSPSETPSAVPTSQATCLLPSFLLILSASVLALLSDTFRDERIRSSR